jgi:hypothetical protein
LLFLTPTAAREIGPPEEAFAIFFPRALGAATRENPKFLYQRKIITEQNL